MAEQKGNGTSIPQIQLGLEQLGERKWEIVYKRRGSAIENGIQENWEKRLREEQERETESCNSRIGLRVLNSQSFPLYLGKVVLISIITFFVPYYLAIYFLNFPLWNSCPFYSNKLIV